MPPRSRVVVGNWKMNGALSTNAALLDAIVGGLAARPSACDVAVCVPFPYLAQAQAALSGSPVALGSQDVSEHASGAYTGEVASSMLREFGCRYAIVGHSERRTLFGDTDERVGLKAERAIGAGLTPIVCVGETLQEREQGRAEVVVARQLDAVLQRTRRRSAGRRGAGLRAGMGDRHRQDCDAERGAGDACVDPQARRGVRCGRREGSEDSLRR